MWNKKQLLCLLSAVTIAASCTGCTSSGIKSKNPLTVTVWTYYNGDLLEAFNSLVNEFNEGEGKEKGIKVECSSLGSVNDLETNVLNSAEGKVGAAEMPNIFSAYADTAYTMDQMGKIADISDYLTAEEKETYVKSYLEEGDFSGDGSIKIFPVAKSTELLFLNETDWEAFAGETGASYEDLETVEGLLDTAKKYYDWSDGKAFFGRDAMANYMLIGAKELGSELFQVKDGRMTLDFKEEIARKLWDSYYVPYIKGYFNASGRFRSDDIRTGNLIGYVGSTASATYFPTQVVESDTKSHDITLKVLPAPVFEGSEAYAVQQGAGMVVTKASVEFLKWFTRTENNIAFSVGSGYLPVTREANDRKKIKSCNIDISDSMEEVLSVGVDTVNTSTMYTPKAFEGSNDARNILEHTMSDLAKADRTVVEERIQNGEDLETAAAGFLTEEYFKSWYQDTLSKLQAFER